MRYFSITIWGRIILFGFLAVTLFAEISCKSRSFNADDQLEYCVRQADLALSQIRSDSTFPQNIPTDSENWRYSTRQAWTSGFWPGILWYLYQYTQDNRWKVGAARFTRALTPDAYRSGFTHDLGFVLYDSFGRGYESTGNLEYKEVLLAAADSLATLFNPKVGTILSWPAMVGKMGWPHNTIIDNMMNLELLFWAAKNGGGERLYEIAVRHAATTMKNQFRPDYSNYHVVVYDTADGSVVKKITHQGYSDSSMWARGQAWAIYGFTMVYRETHQSAFLDFAQHVADIYIKRLPDDMIPYWDFDAPHGSDVPKDASAAAITASALLELSTYVRDENKAHAYYNDAVNMLKELSSDRFQSRKQNDAFLMHSTGNKPANSEVDISIIYADYYYLEALLRLRKLDNNEPVFAGHKI